MMAHELLRQAALISYGAICKAASQVPRPRLEPQRQRSRSYGTYSSAVR
jgi:hypothetical protein